MSQATPTPSGTSAHQAQPNARQAVADAIESAMLNSGGERHHHQPNGPSGLSGLFNYGKFAKCTDPLS